ncbi:hypothetical protein CAL14_18370 [Bordetella genomosp. 9]|uniref:hypothetical protein n=1 Tax=Bordetella genomosp. 9 TaxID=1416803 RepID=UPI000A2957B3|nr:hypothetical protein [Bordetella genomosp. 9]ARP92845.1 hypothetical protein CAL14_18370 [Bordetella genomosp. 9]
MQLLERPISFRLSDPARKRYEAAAAERGMTLSSYLRSRLEVDDQIEDHVSQLRLALLDRDESESVGSAPTPLLLELLLLIRKQVSPAELRAVHQELDRLGHAPWTPGQRPPETD